MEPEPVVQAPQGDAPTVPAEPVQPAVAASTAPVAPVAPAVTPAPVPTAPAEMKDRSREQFEKLLDSNRRLFEANEYLRRQVEQRQESNRTFDPLQRPTGSPTVDPNEFVEVDPETGTRFINESKLQARLQEIQGRATKAEQTVENYIKTVETREIDRQNKEAFGVYPELDPSGPKFDLGFHKLVRGALYDSMNFADENGGRPFSFKEAADFVRAQIPKASMTSPAAPAPAIPAPATPPEQDTQALKEQGSAQVASQPRGNTTISDEEELEDLRYRTRYGNDDAALAKRILNTDHTRKKAEDET